MTKSIELIDQEFEREMTEIVTYFYAVEGSASGGQTWATDGTVDVVGRGEFLRAVSEAMCRSFATLTLGKAIYGQPGVGCTGPYRVTKFTISEREESK